MSFLTLRDDDIEFSFRAVYVNGNNREYSPTYAVVLKAK